MTEKISVVEDILSANTRLAEANRQLLRHHRVLALNFMASPGAGKTTLLLATLEALRGRLAIAAIEGDVASRVDADKIAAAGAPVVQINTGGGCHLDAPMIQKALHELPLDQIDLLMIENVGNLICPVGFDLGQSFHIAILSVPEGDDKPFKYPGIFAAVDAIVVSKVDLLPYVDFDLPAFEEVVRGMNPHAPIFPLSARTGQGMDPWIEWLENAARKA